MNHLQKKKLVTAFALAVAVTGSSTGFSAPTIIHEAAAAQAATLTPPAAFHPAAAAAGIAAKKVNLKKVTTYNLNLRQGKSTGTRVLVTIPKKSALTVTETSGTWSKTNYKGKTGWVASRYLKNAPAAKAPAKPQNQKVTTYNLNLRQGKSTGTKVLVMIPKNTTLKVTQTSGSWSRTSYKGKTGWVASRYLKNASSSTSPAPKTTYRWTTANVNVRKGPGTSYASLGVVRANERVTYIKTSKGWSNVKSSKGTGWITNRYLATVGQHPVSVYGTLRKGQSAYHLLRGRTASETKTRVPYFNMYLKPDQTWWSFIIPSSSSARSVVVERMVIKPVYYHSTLANLDKWERFDPRKPLADQNYNRKLVTDQDGKRSWAYVGASKISNYLTKSGIRVTSGDYLRRF